ncbi:hypothetical protein [Nannocystis pusilla]|uniref:hypothetical protein n=1 Tax=Nannocystis pusilla TaxID=889268 RepID=UPI003B7D9F0D
MAELESRDGKDLTHASVNQIRCRLNKLTCCDREGGCIAHLGVTGPTGYRPEHIRRWYDHMVDCRGWKVAWTSLVMFRGSSNSSGAVMSSALILITSSARPPCRYRRLSGVARGRSSSPSRAWPRCLR